ncbi:shikimate kinase [Pelagibacterales bacterium SAG-MED39]|nr:shikimate kinase [Pelagibacterales bacterium SAG-MED39]
MKSRENIVFLGMMGSGKSSIGRLVSNRLQVDFFDIDNLIEKQMNMTISNIFNTKGEIFFREVEEKITLKILKKNNIVISLGGGAFLNKKIRDEVLTNNYSFWLKVRTKDLIKRIKESSKRPIAFKAKNNELLELIKKRSNIYSKAMYKIKCSELTKNEIVNKIIDIYETTKNISKN